MTADRVARILHVLVLVLVGLYLVAGVAGLFADFDDTRDTVLWVSFLLGGAALMLLGRLVRSSAWLSAALVSIGAAAGGLALFWTIVVPLAVAAVIAMSFGLARRSSATV